MIGSWEGSLGERFAAQARKRPHATALVHGGHAMSYSELYARAGAVAAGLVARGVGREARVGLALERSAAAIIAIVAVTLAGGAYVPLNPRHPLRRLHGIVGNARPTLLIGDGGLDLGVRVCTLDTLYGSGDEVVTRADGGALAYVMYTSGSTGRPKGVMIEHRGVLRLVVDTDYVDFGPSERVVQAAPLEFDASTWEIWGALLNGGALVVATPDEAVVPTHYAELVRREAATSAWLTAPLFHQFVNEDPGMFAPLRQLIVGGDVVSAEHARRALAANPGLRLYNGYGPTENTTFTTVGPISPDARGALPIGRALPGTHLMVLNERGEELADGQVGELYVGGAGLARGYCGDPELTRQRFVVVDERRLYRTGDRVHRDGEGVFHFHGRADEQVKIRGHLVEPAEVTAALLAIEGVRDAHVRVRPDAIGDSSLVAYVSADVAIGTIRDRMAARLPAYLCPERYVPLGALPLNDNGKVDVSRLELAAEHLPLAKLWAEVLGRQVEHPGDHFFELGGSSISLGTLLGRIHRTLGVRLTFLDTLGALTFEAMGALVAEARRSVEPEIGTGGQAGDLHPHQRALYALWQLDPRSLAYNVPFCLDLSGPVDPARLEDALSQVVARHDAFWMRFSGNGTRVRQEPIPARRIDVPLLPDAPLATPFRLDAPPLLRAALVPLAADRYQLHLDVHHVVFDGVSLRVLVGELLAAYARRPLPPVRLSYLDAAQWAHERLRLGEHADSEAYWRRRLADPPGLMLPVRDGERSGRGAVHRVRVEAALSAAADVSARRHGTSVYTILLTAYLATLARLSGQRDLMVGTPVSGRYHSEVQDVVGMFAATVCVRARIGPNTTLTELVGQVDRLAAEAITHSGFPPMSLGLIAPGGPGVSAFFAYQNIDFHHVRVGALAASTRLLNPGTTRFDLNLQAYPRPDGLALELEYSLDRFGPDSAEYLLRQYLVALCQLCTGPQEPVQPAERLAAGASLPDFDF